MISGDRANKLIKKFKLSIKSLQIGDDTHEFIGGVFIRIHELDKQVGELEKQVGQLQRSEDSFKRLVDGIKSI